MTTALLVFIAIVLVYPTDSLPVESQNRVDAIVVEHARHWLKFRVPKESVQRKLRIKRRRDALLHFILALSDQQLVTGLATLITAFAQRCNISVYYFNLVVALAWFSSTTHLRGPASIRFYI